MATTEQYLAHAGFPLEALKACAEDIIGLVADGTRCLYSKSCMHRYTEGGGDQAAHGAVAQFVQRHAAA